MEILKLYDGELKVCPRCKGHKYIRGQKYSSSSHLPNYKKIDSGLCFLCEGSGEAFYTNDNKVLKCIKKCGKNYIVEYSPTTGRKIGMVSSFKNDDNKNRINKNNNPIKDLTNKVKEEDFFPTMYEMVWNDWSSVADIIFKEYPNAKPVSVDRFYGDYEDENNSGGYINFLYYYNPYGRPIKPFYINPPYDIYVDDGGYKGVVMVDKNYLYGVSGTYIESKKRLCLGVKTTGEFKYYEVENIENIDSDNFDLDARMSMLSLFLERDMKKISEIIVKDLYVSLSGDEL